MKVLVLDTETASLDTREIEDDLDTFYSIIGCDCIDIPVRKIGGKYYDIICDDEGLLKSDTIVSAINENTWETMLVGNLIICNHDDEGNMVGLTDEDIEKIRQHTTTVMNACTLAQILVLKVDY